MADNNSLSPTSDSWPFAVDITLDEAKASTKGTNEFRCTTKVVRGTKIAIWNYDFCHGKTFPDPATAPNPQVARLWKIRRECRGLIFDAQTGKLLSRRFHKFFNIGQNEENASEKLNWNDEYVVVEKYDGCMMSPLWLPATQEIVWGTKQGPTEVSERMEQEFLAGNKIEYNKFAAVWLQKDFTPLFEWCSMKHHIVLNYETDLLVLLAIRNNRTGGYVSYAEMTNSASTYGVPVTPVHRVGKGETINQFMDKIKAKQGSEGCVVHFQNSHLMYKVKSDWYFEQSRQDRRLPNQEKEIWQLILDNEMDDLMPSLSKHMKKRIDTFTEDLFDTLAKRGLELKKHVESLKEKHGLSEKKDFVEFVRKNEPAPLQTVLFQLYDGKDLAEVMIAAMRKALTPQTFEQGRHLFANDISFDY